MNPGSQNTVGETFTTTTHGKWLLAGEHAVIRGCPALVFPIMSKKLKLTYHNNDNHLHADFCGSFSEDMHLSFWSVVEHGLELLGKSLNAIRGTFLLDNNIPIGSGMGASAALCVALTRWYIWQGWLEKTKLFNFAKQLEDLFHAQSSGVDIAGACANNGGVFFHQGHCTPLQQNWQPYWYLSYSGHIGITAHCVKQVQQLWKRDPQEAVKIDANMQASVQLTQQALADSSKKGFHQLAQAITQAQACFQAWQLIDPMMQKHIKALQKAGAVATKPTGSGAGGYILSLWESAPPDTLPQTLIPL